MKVRVRASRAPPKMVAGALLHDHSNVEGFCTYLQTLETYTVHCEGLVAPADVVKL